MKNKVPKPVNECIHVLQYYEKSEEETGIICASVGNPLIADNDDAVSKILDTLCYDSVDDIEPDKREDFNKFIDTLTKTGNAEWEEYSLWIDIPEMVEREETDAERLRKTWEFIESNKPDWSSSNLVAEEGDLCKYVDDEYDVTDPDEAARRDSIEEGYDGDTGAILGRMAYLTGCFLEDALIHYYGEAYDVKVVPCPED